MPEIVPVLVTGVAATVVAWLNAGVLRERIILSIRRDAERYRVWSEELLEDSSDQSAWRTAVAVRLGIVGAAVLVFVLTGSLVFGVALALGLTVVPNALQNSRRAARRKRLAEQLPDAVDVMVSAVRAGQSLSAAIKAVADRLDAPTSAEFALITREHEARGLSIEDALARARRRIDLEGFTMVSTALIINSQQGGDLLRMLERSAESTRELTRLQKKIEIETAEVRAEEKIVLAMTPLFGLLVCLFDPAIPDILFHSLLGNLLVVLVVGIQIGCVMWIRAIVRTTV